MKQRDRCCKGYITLVDSNDYVKVYYCEKMIIAIEKYNNDLAYFGQFLFVKNRLKKFEIEYQMVTI